MQHNYIWSKTIIQHCMKKKINRTTFLQAIKHIWITLLFLNHYSSVLWAMCRHCKCITIKNTSTSWNFYMSKEFLLMVTFFWILQKLTPNQSNNILSYQVANSYIYTHLLLKKKKKRIWTINHIFCWPNQLHMSVLTLYFIYEITLIPALFVCFHITF